jgi:hypothetical protein
MTPEFPGASRLQLRNALAGLEAGVFGSLAFSAWLMLADLWQGRSVWLGSNLFATLVWGTDVYVNAFQRTTLAGLSLVVLLYGSLGVFWGLIVGDRLSPFLRVIGALTGLVVYWLLFGVIWPRVSPLLVIYAPLRQLQAAHMFWGIALASSPRISRKIAGTYGSSPSGTPEPVSWGRGTTE